MSAVQHRELPRIPRGPRLAQTAGMGRFIPGVYNYCDRWCERCRLQARCRVYRDMTMMEAAISRGDSSEAVSRLMDEQYAEDEREESAGRPPLTASAQLEWDRILELANRPLAPDELDAIDRAEERIRDRIDADPLSLASRELDELTRGVAAALRPVLDEKDDPVLTAAIETIERFAWLLSAKVHRALSGHIRAEADEDAGGMDDFGDGDGTAKLVRLVLGEARAAWTVLRDAGVGNGAPDGIIRRIDTLDTAMAARFPRAMWFVRPGFDEKS
jgi:hypothetical protein